MRRVVMLLAAALAAGCAHAPQSPQALREAGPSLKKEDFEVPRRHRDVAASLQRQAKRCLDVKLKGVAFQATVVASSRKAEMYLQRRPQAAAASYVLVVDAYPSGRARTRVELFAAPEGTEALVRAVKGWTQGENFPCPDLAKAG